MDLKDYLAGVFQSGTNSHFYLFSEEGAATEALYVLFCKTNNACRHCSGCASVESESNPDIFVLRPEPGSRIKDEQVEEALAHTEIKTAGAYRAVVITEAEKMTVRAQNHLLKSLEEAPDGVIYLMETRFPESLLPTVVSRAIRIRGKKKRGETSELTEILLHGSRKELDKALKSYKDNRSGLLEELRIAVDEITAKYVAAIKRSEGEESAYRGLADFALLTEEVMRNLEQNGNFDLNTDMLIYGRHFG
ncbi:MAG: hypothetical protein Q4A41_03015 [Bacillota bacterium]|nr:hypothetical protein [Bacillota bacterium]